MNNVSVTLERRSPWVLYTECRQLPIQPRGSIYEFSLDKPLQTFILFYNMHNDTLKQVSSLIDW